MLYPVYRPRPLHEKSLHRHKRSQMGWFYSKKFTRNAAGDKRLLPILRAASSPLPSQNLARANDPAGYAG